MNRNRAFSLIEILLTVSTIALLATVGSVTYGSLSKSSKSAKIQADVASLNRAVTAYLASGGSLTGVSTASDVLTRLKASSTNTDRQPGMVGSKLDPGTSFVMQSASEAASNEVRAYWDNTAKKFTLATSGSVAGIKQFVNDSSIAETDYGTSTTGAPLLYAGTDTWVWDYAESSPPAPVGPTNPPVSNIPGNNTPTPGTPPGNTDPPEGLPLAAPQFSVAPGSYPIGTYASNGSYTLPMVLTNPNAAGTSQIYYTLNGADWQPYTGGSLSIPPGASVAAQAIASLDVYRNSDNTFGVFEATPQQLLPSTFKVPSSTFSVFSNRTIPVKIENPNDPAISKVVYRIGDGPFQDYTGLFHLRREHYQNGVTLEAKVVSIDSPYAEYYLASSPTSLPLTTQPAVLSGTGSGVFTRPVGESQMVTNISGNQTNSFFSWGSTYSNGRPVSGWTKSTLTYQSSSFSSITDSERFQIGSIVYYNGTIASGTGADAIDLVLNLNFVLNGVPATAAFTFSFDLINVLNQNNPNNPWLDADYVRIRSAVSNQTIFFNGIEFALRLEFGETTPNGLAQFDEFHVLENASSSTKVYGTLEEVGTVAP